MARTKSRLKGIMVYGNDDERDIIRKAAAREKRPVSSWLLYLGLQRAQFLEVNDAKISAALKNRHSNT